MCAKPAKKSASQPAPTATAPASPVVAPVAAEVRASVAEAPPAWIDSSDPRRRLVGQIVLVGVWLYVAALWLLALDQTFHWGIFGPKVPPVP